MYTIQLKGIPAILRVLQAENPSEKLEIALPPVSVRFSPFKTAAMAIVTTMGCRFSFFLKRFVRQPIPAAAARTSIIAAANGTPCIMNSARMIEEKGRTPATVRSIPPDIITRVIPKAMIASMMKLSTSTQRLAAVKK